VIQCDSPEPESSDLPGGVRAHINLHPGLERDGVDGGSTTDAPHVKTGSGSCLGQRVGDDCKELDGPSKGVGRIHQTESPPGMPARALERDSVPGRAQTHANDGGQVIPVYFDEGIDLQSIFSKEMLDSPEVSETLLPDTSQEDEIRIGGYVRFFKSAEGRENHYESPCIVPNSRSEKSVSPNLDGDIGPFREDRVQVCPQNNRPISLTTPPKCQDVPDPVDVDRVGSRRLEKLGKGASTSCFLEGRSRDLRQEYEIIPGLGLQAPYDPESFLDTRLGGQPRHLCVESKVLGYEGTGPALEKKYEEGEQQVKSMTSKERMTEQQNAVHGF